MEALSREQAVIAYTLTSAYAEFVEKDNATASLRFLVVDGNSGRMGSLTIPAGPAQKTP